MVRLLTSVLLAAASAVAVHAQDFKLYGVNYNIRAGPDYAPPAEKCKNASQIQQELATLKTVTNIVRLYSLTDCDQASAAVPAVIAAGLQLELGLWVGPDPSVFAAERAKFQELVKNTALINSSSVVSIHVGSEAIYRKDVNVTTAVANLREIKAIAKAANLAVPVSIGDIGDTYLAYPTLFEEVDFVSANLFPFWEKIPSDEAADQFYSRYEKVADAAKAYNKTVVIGETGWASNGTHAGASKASPTDAATFFADFYKIAKEHHLQYYYFAAFDEAWKLQHETADSTVEGYFGIFTADGKLKPEYAELKLDSELEADESDESDGSDDSDGSEEEETEEEDDTPARVKPASHVTVRIKVHRAHK